MKTIAMTEPLYDYVVEHCQKPSKVLEDLSAETAKHPMSIMQVPADQGTFMNITAKMINAKKILEIGCYTGYSTVSLAEALPKDGKLYSLDISEDYASIARRFLSNANLSDKVEFRIAPALETLASLQEDHRSSFDMAFIDADKEPMWDYYEACLDLIRPNGVILVDNVLYSGRVIEEDAKDPSTLAIREFNERIVRDDRVQHMLLHISDGIFVLRKL